MSAPSRQQRRFEARKGVRVPGFTPVPNARINGRHAMEVMRLVGMGVKPVEAEQRAWRNVASTLAPPRMVRSYARKPSKSDDPAYRKSIWPASAIEAQRAATPQSGAVHESATAQPGCPNSSSNDSERQS